MENSVLKRHSVSEILAVNSVTNRRGCALSSEFAEAALKRQSQVFEKKLCKRFNPPLLHSAL